MISFKFNLLKCNRTQEGFNPDLKEPRFLLGEAQQKNIHDKHNYVQGT